MRLKPVSIEGMRRAKPFGSQSGFALPVILAISLVITVLAMSIALSVRQKVKVGIELRERMTAYTQTYSAMNVVLCNILSSTFTPCGIEIHGTNGAVTKWNLYGKPIRLNDTVTVRLRDLGGMVSPIFNPLILEKLIEYKTKDPGTAIKLTEELADWQDADDLKRLNGAESFDYKAANLDYTPRNFYIQVPQEMRLLLGFSKKIYDSIKNDIAYWTGGTMNYLTMSDDELQAILGNKRLTDQIIDLREKGELTGLRFQSLTGIQPSEDVVYMPLGWIRIKVTAKVGKALDRIDAVIVKRQTRKSPFQIVEWRR